MEKKSTFEEYLYLSGYLFRASSAETGRPTKQRSESGLFFMVFFLTRVTSSTGSSFTFLSSRCSSCCWCCCSPKFSFRLLALEWLDSFAATRVDVRFASRPIVLVQILKWTSTHCFTLDSNMVEDEGTF